MDPEKPMSLEDLNVVQEDLITVTCKINYLPKFYPLIEDPASKVPTIEIIWVPTVPDCHLATTIALCLRTKLYKEISVKNAKIDIIGRWYLVVEINYLIIVQDGKHSIKK